MTILGYSLEHWQKYELKFPFEVEISKFPHTLWAGSSGSGKSYALKFFLRNLVTSENVDLTFCNFKDSSDFRFLKVGNCNYYTVEDCIAGFNEFYFKFKEVQAKGIEYDGKHLHLLIFDEFPAFLSWYQMTDKKLATQLQMRLSEILMLGRSYGFGVHIVSQKPLAELFLSQRENFFIYIALGNVSKEVFKMINFEIEYPQETIFGVGEGLIKIDGKGTFFVKYPKILDMDKLEAEILSSL